LDYYLTRDALKAFTKYKKQIIFDDADSEYNLQKIIESLKYIKRFIKEKKISLNEYLNYNSGQYLPDYIFHLKNDNISFYVLFGFENFEEEFSKISPEDKKDIFMDFYRNWYELKRKFYFSKKSKNIVRLGMEKISKKS
jgi:hypothetical protein